MMKCFFAFDHFNYARWGSVHLFDLMILHLFCPDVYEEFMKGNFSFQKTSRVFSKITPDQVHGQNNEVIKGIGGAIPLLNRENDPGLERWELSGTEVTRLINEFEGITNESQTPLEKHHENTPAFQKRFVSDVKKLESCFPCNPLEINDLVKISNTEVRYHIDVYGVLYSLVSTGESKFLDFFYNRLIKGKEAINDPIKKNFFLLPGKVVDKQKNVFLLPGKVVDKQKKESDRMNYSINTLTKLNRSNT